MKTLVEIPDALLDTQAPLDVPTQILLTLLRAWLSRPETRQLVRAAADAIQDDLAIQLYSEPLPPTERGEGRRGGLTSWVKTQLDALESWTESRVEESVRTLTPQIPLQDQARHVAEELIGAELRRETRRRLRKTLATYAVRGCAHRWATTHLGESVLPGEPQQRSGIWLIPILDREQDTWLTTLRLNSTGEFLSDPKALREEIAVRQGKQRPPLPTGAALPC